ncbi:hypothetical protein ECANGB1_2765 [Enterospora canceri]|uniref:Uncharacterized protein n=1 Tax=Enterospora canceri TaxID=1081671 RepID=A0A1Y1S9T8_9MICR|nr:hypothetical protein ECANGB1_2765 [Enterospora canceri]
MQCKMIDQSRVNLRLAINTFIFKLNSVLHFLLCYNQIHRTSIGTIYCVLSAELLVEIFYRNRRVELKKMTKSYGIITILIIVLLPVFKNMTSHIASDTIHLVFGVCSVIFTIESSKNYICRINTGNYVFDRNTPIPIDIALLIPYKFQNNDTVGNVAAALSLFNILSRIRLDYEVLYLLKIGILIFYYIPFMQNAMNVTISTRKTVRVILISQVLFLLLGDWLCFALSVFALIPTWLILLCISRSIYVK